MNKYLVVLVLLSLSCKRYDKVNTIKTTTATENIVSKVVIKHTGLDMETPIRIDCNSLESYFQGNIKDTKIVDEDKIDKVQIFLKQCSANKKYDNYNIDVRYTINLYYINNEIEQICGNSTLIEIRGSIYKVDENALELLNSLVH